MRTLAPLVLVLMLTSPGTGVERFPLGPGMRWVYSEREVEGEERLAETTVEEHLGEGVYRLRSSAGSDSLVQVDGARVYSVVQGPGGVARTLLLDFEREAGESWEIPCQGVVVLESTSERLVVTAGTFEGCYLFRTEIGCLPGLGPARAWYAPGIGRVKSESGSPGGTVTQELVRFEPPGAFLRGDSNADGKADISDAVFALRWLFLGEAAPRCEESTDMDGDGRVNITDAIYLLEHLFLGGSPPPPPFPACARPELYSLPCEAGGCN